MMLTKEGRKMAIPAKEFKAVVKSLNKVLDDDGQDKIKIVGVKKAEVESAFTDSVNGYIEDDNASALPDDVIDFYNKYIANDDDDEADDEKEEKKSKKSSKKKEKKEKKKKAPNFIPSMKNREASCVDALKKGGQMDTIVAKADAIYVKASGKEPNIKQSKRLMERAIKYLYRADALEISEKGVYKLK